MVRRVLLSLFGLWSYLFFLFSFGPFFHASALSSSSQVVLDDSDLIHDPNYKPSEGDRENYKNNGGNDAVHAIWSVLRDFEPTWRDDVTNTGSSDSTSTVWYYVKATFRLLFMNAPTQQPIHRDDGQPRLKGDLLRAVDTLKYATAFDDQDAIFLLAEMNFHGNFSHPRNFKEAFRLYYDLAALDGNHTAQNMVGLMYATGIGDAVERDQAKAMLYHTFAADQGNVRSEMTVGFRHYVGIGTARNCDKASQYYKRVADEAMQFWMSGPPGGTSILRNAYRWVDDFGGAYGEGASASSSGPNAPQDRTTVENAITFWEMRESQGDWNAVWNLGKHYYDGNRGYRRNMRKAQKQFMKIARSYWGKDGKVSPKAPRGSEKVAGKAAAYLGRMALRGEGVEQNFEKARMWFVRGIAEGDAFSQYHLGLMHRDGLGVQKDGLRAATLLKAAAEQNLYVAQSALGAMFLDQGDTETAGRYFELAAAGNVMEAYYYLAELTNKGIGRERNCALAVAYYKVVAERVEMMHSAFLEASTAYEQGDMERALVASIVAAEQGSEVGQANVAHLLDDKTSGLAFLNPAKLWSLFSSSKPRRSALLNNPELALIYYTRSARQSNTDSLVKMGDFYLSGFEADSSEIPVSEEDNLAIPNADKASSCYTHAAESHHSAQSMWNLGWMHENGVGPIPQDFHMAKRYYDLALEMNKEAYLPVKLALSKLRLRSWWNGISGGKINSIRDDEKKEKKSRTFTEWITHFLDAAEEMDAAEAAAMEHEEGMEFSSGDQDPMPGGDEDHLFADGYDDVIDDGLVESLIIIGLAATLGFLVWYRQQRQLQARQQQQGQAQGQVGGFGPGAQQAQAQAQEQQGPGQGGGFFPNPGDPNFNQWAAGGVGH